MKGIMKGEIIKLAKEKGFKSGSDEGFQTGDGFFPLPDNGWTDTEYYLYLCEVQKWLIDDHEIYVVSLPSFAYWTFKIIDVQCNPEKEIERPPYKDVSAFDYDSRDQSLEAGILEALKNI